MRHARSLYLPTALLLFASLTGCATKAVKPSHEPAPPQVKCEQGQTPDLADWPEDWLRDGPPWAIEVLGVLEEERRLRAIEHQCLQRLRKAGVIG